MPIYGSAVIRKTEFLNLDLIARRRYFYMRHPVYVYIYLFICNVYNWVHFIFVNYTLLTFTGCVAYCTQNTRH